MNLGDLLDTLKRDILHDRSDQVAGDSDQLWSDTTLVRYIDIAQRRFARRSLCIIDGTSAVTRFATVPYQQDYMLDPSIITVRSIRSLGNGLWVTGVYTPGAYNTASPPVFVPSGLTAIYPDRGDLARMSHAARRRQDIVDTGLYFDVNNVSTLNPGKPLAFETDESLGEANGSSGVVTVRLYPIPDAANSPAVMQMRVSRLPATRLTPATMSAVPEIPEDYHMDILDYAAYLALRIVDHELGDAARAAEFEASFERHVQEARAEILRKAYAPQVWGFGGNGYSYVGN